VTLPKPVFAAVFNFRDLGGLPTTDGRSVQSGRLYRSDALHRITDEDAARLGALGIRSIIDLRRPHEIKRDGRVPEHLGLAYHNIHPAHREWDSALYDEAAGAQRYLADRYLDMAEEGSAGLGEALRFIADPGNAPLVMHCFAGKDRTGVLAALTLNLLGVSDEDIATDYARSEEAQVPLTDYLRSLSPERYDIDTPMHFVVCPPDAMRLFLSELRERYGSIRAYTAAAGVTDGHVASLRAHLLG
jgi:protein tyrosine/serine phosphatase